MIHYKKFFYLLVVQFFIFHGYICAISDKNWIDTKEHSYLELFLRTFFLEDDFSYTLFGEKPMSFSGVIKNSLDPIENIYHLLPNCSAQLFLWKSAETFKVYREYLDQNYLCIFNENPKGTFIYFIHKKAFLKTIETNIDVFLKELGEDFTPSSFLSEILEEKKPLLEIIHYHEGILGILLGYGRHNSLLFQKKADILGRCWGYDQDIKQNAALYLCTTDRSSAIGELEYVDNKLKFFSEECEYCPLIPVSPLCFGADNAHPETKKLKEKYSLLHKKINEAYTKFNPFEVMLKMLGILQT